MRRNSINENRRREFENIKERAETILLIDNFRKNIKDGFQRSIINDGYTQIIESYNINNYLTRAQFEFIMYLIKKDWKNIYKTDIYTRLLKELNNN